MPLPYTHCPRDVTFFTILIGCLCVLDDPLSKRSDRMASIGGVGLVMGVMDTFAAKPSIQARACNTLGHLAASGNVLVSIQV